MMRLMYLWATFVGCVLGYQAYITTNTGAALLAALVLWMNWLLHDSVWAPIDPSDEEADDDN